MTQPLPTPAMDSTTMNPMTNEQRFKLHRLLREHATAAQQGEAFKAGQIGADITSFVAEMLSEQAKPLSTEEIPEASPLEGGLPAVEYVKIIAELQDRIDHLQDAVAQYEPVVTAARKIILKGFHRAAEQDLTTALAELDKALSPTGSRG